MNIIYIVTETYHELSNFLIVFPYQNPSCFLYAIGVYSIMLIIETPVFTKRVLGILTDDEYREFQLFLAANPGLGDLIPGSGGLRKIRWNIAGKGKRGGSRIIYYWTRSKDSLLMIFIFQKNEQSDLTKDQLKKLSTLVTQELL